MARQVLPIAGAIIGGYFGGPQGAQIGFAIGSLVGNAVDPQVIKTPGLQNIPVQTASEGGFRQVVYGTCWINNTNIIDFSEVRKVTQRERQGKGGGPVVESERLYRTYAIGLGEPLAGIRVIRRDGKIVYDVRPGSTIIAESTEFATRFRFYSGAEDQLPDPDLEAINGVGNTPYYRGTAYLVFPNDDLTDNQGRIPTYEVEGVQAVPATFRGVRLCTDRISYSGDFDDLQAGASLGVINAINYVVTSPDGLHCLCSARSLTSPGYFKVAAYDPDAETWSLLTDAANWPDSGPDAMAWADNNTFVAVFNFGGSGDTDVWVYTISGTTITRIAANDFGVLSSPVRESIAFDADKTRIAIGEAAGNNTFNVYDYADGVLTNRRGENDTGSASGDNRLCFRPLAGSPYFVAANINVVELYSDSGSAITFLDSVSVPGQFGLYWFGNYIYAYGFDGFSTWTITVIEFDEANETLTVISSDVVAGSAGSSITGDGRYFAIRGNGPRIFSISNTTPPVFTEIYTAPSAGGTVESVSWSQEVELNTIDAVSVDLQTVIEDICPRCGLAPSEYDMSALTDTVQGVTLGGAYNGAGAVTLFMPAYFFDITQPDKVLIGVKRGAAAVDTITRDDLVEEPDENLLRGQDIEYPRLLMLKYLNPGQNYAAPAAVVSRQSPDIRVTGEAQIDLPISFSETEALRVADRILKVTWEDLNGEITFSLPSGPFAWLAPTDCLGLSLRGGLYRIRVEKVEESAYVLKITARRDRQSAYTSNLTALPLPSPEPPPPSLPGGTNFLVMNLPVLSDGDDGLGVYIAMCGNPGFAWQGAQVEYRGQGDTDWLLLGTYNTVATIGELTAALPYASPNYTDNTNTLSVELINPDEELDTLTNAQYLAEGNPFAIVYPDGTAEIGQFQTATDNSGGSWDLTRLQRGRLTTTPGPHLFGASFVMLSGAFLVPIPTAYIGRTLEFRVTSLGASPETAPVYSILWEPQVIQQEFAPVYLTLERSGGTISGQWAARHRLGTDINPIPSINFTGYRVTLTDGTTTTVLPDTTATEFSTSDSAFTGPITVTVQGVNRITGAGPGTSETI